MSQAGILNFDNLPGGLVVETLTGNIGGPVPPTAHNIDTIADPSTGFEVSGNPATSTLTLISRQYLLTTNNAVAQNIFTFTLANNQAITVQFAVVGARANYGASIFKNGVMGARRVAGGAILVDIPNVNGGDDGGLTLSVDGAVAGNNIELTVTGEAATTWNWIATVSYITV